MSIQFISIYDMSPYDLEHHANVPSAPDKTYWICYATLESQTFKNCLLPKGSHSQFLINKLNSIFTLVINFSFSRKKWNLFFILREFMGIFELGFSNWVM